MPRQGGTAGRSAPLGQRRRAGCRWRQRAGTTPRGRSKDRRRRGGKRRTCHRMYHMNKKSYSRAKAPNSRTAKTWKGQACQGDHL
eukprot:5254351-Pyramimonas_sp.AAC.1